MRQPKGLHAQIQELTVEVAVLKTRLGTSEIALQVQAKEYERRLDVLNHAHQQAEIVQHTYVTRELHDQLYNEMIRRIDIINGQINRISEMTTMLSTKNATIAAGFAALLALANLAVVAWHFAG